MNIKQWLLSLLLSFLINLITPTDAFPNQFSLAEIAGDNIGERSTGTALNSLGNQGVCYQDISTDSLNFAYHNGNAWNVEIVDNDNGSGHDTGVHCALIFDNNDRPHIVYFNFTDEELKHAYKTNNVWVIATIDDQLELESDFGVRISDSQRLSIARNTEGKIATAYYDAAGRDLLFAEWDGIEWTVEVVLQNGDVGKYASVDYDHQDNPGIAFMNDTDNAHATLMYIHHDGAHWQAPETIDDDDFSGSYNSLKFDTQGVPHVCYRLVNAANYNYLKYTNKVGGAWNSPITLDHGTDMGHYAQMTMGNDGNAHIIYRLYFTSALFGSANYLMTQSLYFIEGNTPAQIYFLSDRITVSVAPKRNYNGLSIAIDEDNNLVYALAIQNFGNHDSSLYAGDLTSWQPMAKLLSPDNNNHTANNGQIQISWDVFDPDLTAQIRFFYYDENWNQVLIGNPVNAQNNHNYALNMGALAPGNYTLYSQISNDGFIMSVSSPAPHDLVVPAPVVAQPVVAQPVVAQPVVAQPVVAQPVVAQPVVAQPVVAQPVVAQPVVAQPQQQNQQAQQDAQDQGDEALEQAEDTPSSESPDNQDSQDSDAETTLEVDEEPQVSSMADTPLTKTLGCSLVNGGPANLTWKGLCPSLALQLIMLSFMMGQRIKTARSGERP